TYFLLACADDTLLVPETNESNNCKASTNQTTVSGPDLTETSVTDPPATVLDGNSFSVTDTVQNIGNATAAASTTRYYLSTTTSKSGARLLTGSRAVPSLVPSAISTGTVTVTVSAGTAGGTYFLLACADDTLLVPETNESNNCKASTNKTTVSGPDLTETSVTNPPATLLDGNSFSVTDTAQNIGSAVAAASTTRYYLSTTTSKSGARLLTGSRAVPSLAPSATSSGTVTVTVSAGTAAGTYFSLACADDTHVVSETNESNNCKASATQVTVSGPDLVETAVSDPPNTVTPGGTFSVTDTVQNIGNANAAASTTRYYLSTTTSKTASSTLLTGSRSVPSLAPAATSSGNASVTVPSTLPSGTYFLLACSDDTKLVSETNETNNCKASATTTTH
ncbi:MAG TPA: CARDB domain-containing protein, partial [Terriglobales bacterium]|nr:CARDB domain-containing protein [Terriglobales bacterium]